MNLTDTDTPDGFKFRDVKNYGWYSGNNIPCVSDRPSDIGTSDRSGWYTLYIFHLNGNGNFPLWILIWYNTIYISSNTVNWRRCNTTLLNT